MELIIVESPTKSKTLETFLSKKYQIAASFGHIRDLPKSKLGIDVENNFEPQYIIPQKARKNVKAIKEALKKADFVLRSINKVISSRQIVPPLFFPPG